MRGLQPKDLPCVLLAVVMALASCDSDGGDAIDAGDGLNDVDLIREVWSADPSSIEFGELEVGDFDYRTVTFTNQSDVIQEITEIHLANAHSDVRFANTFISQVGRSHRWLDLNGDGHNFEVREKVIEVHGSGTFDVIVQYHPTGGIDECLDPHPSSCGFLVLSGDEHSLSVPIFIPR